MTLRLVTDNVETLPTTNAQDFASQLREFADKVEARAITRMIVVFDSEDGLESHYRGEAINTYELIGMVEAIKALLLNDD